ncbi:helix-turn-helix domain-containing protein [Paenibacillus lutimineralis]|uniref:AraC family transcriptional regulator n=1 Tax=Paenibacillus lutimineralis TaxID=2707005 RepID=A0A3S9V105_9BACL|nr:AraC family transcriptional regulator [Paenibacillus lutimineralis]AZS16284.1 AraC family transcriptional regulator [Paenibacillus lutimineralis]
MEVIDKTQQVIDSLEADIMNVDYEKIAQLTGIPLGLYQRIFTYLCNISLTGYVRKRKLTRSAEMLLSESKSVTEVALECGYESNSSFSRAFKELFSVSPATISRDLYEENAFHPLSFINTDTYYVLKGRRIMANLEKLEYVNTDDMLLIGISNNDYGVTTHELWQVFWEQGFDKKLAELEENQIGMEDCIGVGYMTDFANESGLGDTYIVGKYFKPGTPVPDGMTGRTIKSGMIAKAQISATSLDEIISNAYILISDMVQKNGYTLDYDSFYWLEFYTVSRFCDAMESGAERVILDWHMPCRKYNQL